MRDNSNHSSSMLNKLLSNIIPRFLEENVELFTDGKLGDVNADIVKYVFTVSRSNRIYEQ